MIIKLLQIYTTSVVDASNLRHLLYIICIWTNFFSNMLEL